MRRGPLGAELLNGKGRIVEQGAGGGSRRGAAQRGTAAGFPRVRAARPPLTTLDLWESWGANRKVLSLFARATRWDASLTSLQFPGSSISLKTGPSSREDARRIGLLPTSLQEPAPWRRLKNASFRPDEVFLPGDLDYLLTQRLVALGSPGVATTKGLSAMARVLGRRDEDDKATS